MSVTLKINNVPIKGEASLSGGAGIRVMYTPDSHRLTLSRHKYSFFEAALEAFLERYRSTRYISSINNVPPAPDGLFALLGSECDSTVLGDDTHSLNVTDLCPSCTKCDSQYRVKRQIEFLSLYFNLLKDTNLYDNGVISARHVDLKARCMPEQAGCARVPEEDTTEYNKLLNTVGYLLQEYITTVHMWNYAVNINNNDTQISTPPEDGCGVLVQAKRALPDCSGTKTLKCIIKLTQTGGQGNLSVFVPTPAPAFEPFAYMPDDVDIQITHSGYTTKQISVEFNDLAVAGSCIVTARFLPFVYAVMKAGVQDPTTSGGVVGMSNILNYYEELANSDQLNKGGLFVFPDDGQDSGGSSGEVTQETPGQGSGGVVANGDVGYLSTGVTTEVLQLLEPTESNYNTGKRYPSMSGNGNNNWSIEIKWITSPDDIEMKETYIFSTPQCRVPAPEAVTKDTAFIDAGSSSSGGPEGQQS